MSSASRLICSLSARTYNEHTALQLGTKARKAHAAIGSSEEEVAFIRGVEADPSIQLYLQNLLGSSSGTNIVEHHLRSKG